MNVLVRCYNLFSWCAGYLQSFALLVLRVGIGFALWFSGYSHLTHVQQMVQRFTHWGVPFPTLSVYVSAITEAGGGIFLLSGFGTRVVALLLIVNFMVAYATASHNKFAQLFHGPRRWEAWGDVVNDDAMPFFASAIVFLAFGAGKASVDYILSRTVFRRIHISPDRAFSVTSATETSRSMPQPSSRAIPVDSGQTAGAATIRPKEPQ